MISKKTEYAFHYKVSGERRNFHDSLLDDELKARINIWIEDIIDVILIEPSTIITERLKGLLDDKDSLNIFIAEVLQFFFGSIHIDISTQKSQSIALFILSEIQKTLQNIVLEEI